MAIVSLNGDTTIMQPSAIKEELIRLVHNKTSILGTQRRIWLADKHQVTLTWEAATLTQYASLANYLYNQGNTVVYHNFITGITFTGFATAAEDQFMRGSSWLKNLTATILEV